MTGEKCFLLRFKKQLRLTDFSSFKLGLAVIKPKSYFHLSNWVMINVDFVPGRPLQDFFVSFDVGGGFSPQHKYFIPYKYPDEN